jgi:phosphoenolpyruvate-protein phosphotransferase
MKKGIAVSPGIVVAKAFRIDDVLVHHAPAVLDAAAVTGEVTRLDAACAAVATDLDEVVERIRREVGEEEAAIFRAHRLLLRDPALIGKVKTFILTRHLDARSALREVLDEYSALFARIPDEYLRERLADLRDVVGRIIVQLNVQEKPQQLHSDEPVVLVAPEILPSQAVMFERLPVVGIVTEAGGSTGHAAIVARALGIPAVSGIRGIAQQVQTGDLIVLDGREGHIHVNPGPEVEAAYRKLQREYVDLRDRLIENREHEAVSADGIAVELLANVNSAADAIAAGKVGATGVGLYRTEYLFLTHPAVPSEEEQLAAYRGVIEAAPNRTVTIRTLDLGGDKQVPYLGTHREANPFMGWRSIRLASAYPEFFQTQLRAIFRAGTHGKVSVLFPMISTVEEVQRIKKMVERTRQTLHKAGVPFCDTMPLGVMIEVPAAALCIEAILDEVDFVSIGSNDLVQYVMAADRDNPKVAHLCEPFNPSVFRLLKLVITTCVERNKPVTLCGEMAGRPRCWLPLFGMGLRRASMSPAFVPTIKALTRAVTLRDAQTAAEQTLKLRTVSELRTALTKLVQELCPNIAQLDTLK